MAFIIYDLIWGGKEQKEGAKNDLITVAKIWCVLAILAWGYLYA